MMQRLTTVVLGVLLCLSIKGLATGPVSGATPQRAGLRGHCSAPPAPRVNWSICQKPNAKLSHANLAYANLELTNLSGAPLTGANLFHADAAQADLSNAHLRRAGLSYANLIDANLTGANLTRANLTHANLSEASMTRANLSRTKLTGVVWDNTTCPDGTNSYKDGNSCRGHFKH